MSELESLGGEVEDAIDRVRVPSYVIDRHGIIRWLNPAARKLVGDVRGRQLPSVVAPEFSRSPKHSSDLEGSRARQLVRQVDLFKTLMKGAHARGHASDELRAVLVKELGDRARGGR